MASVWWVEAGEYSDWHVKAIFSTKEKADEYVRVYNASCDEPNRIPPDSVQEKPIDKPIPDLIGHWMIHIGISGNLTKMYGNGDWCEGGPDIEKSGWFQKLDWRGGKLVAFDEPIFYGVGKTKEHARRQAEDLRREYIATYGKKFVPMPEEDLHG